MAEIGSPIHFDTATSRRSQAPLGRKELFGAVAATVGLVTCALATCMLYSLMYPFLFYYLFRANERSGW